MFRIRIVCLLGAVCLLLSGTAVMAAEVESDATYCFSQEDFPSQEPLEGICITQLPQADAGTLLLGSRVLQPGDILTAQQLSQVTFAPVATETDAQATLQYLPIYAQRVEGPASLTISIRGKADQVPAAEDMAVETYKNLPNQGKLKASDPEGETLTYTVIRQPRRGSVELSQDGSFLYTPKKNKVGVDSFTFTATDPAGNVSREATVTVQILKPTDARQYTDTLGLDCRFEAEWLRNTGLFQGETLGNQQCFRPEAPVSQGQFLTMVMELLQIRPMEQTDAQVQEAPGWLQPYLAAAMRAGLLTGWPQEVEFDAHAPITGAQAAVILQNALDLPLAQSAAAAQAREGKADLPTWADTALEAVNANGLNLNCEEILNRAQAAKLLYQVRDLAATAPGVAVFQSQQ